MKYPGTISSKLPRVGTTIFTVMSALAQDHGAINLSQGFPDFDGYPELIDLIHSYMKKGMNQYAPMPGILPLRNALAEKMNGLYGCSIDPETEITITSGGTQAIYTAITAMVREGDEVVVIEPAYDCYVPAIELAGGIPVFVQLRSSDQTIDWESVRRVLTAKTRMIIVNTPHNPTGSVMTAEDMKQLERLVAKTEITIISDEVYEHILFDGRTHESVLRYPKLAERTFAVYSFGKTYHATGWKTGYCIAPENLMREFRRVHQFLVFSANTPIQYALTDFLSNRSYLELPGFFQKKRDKFLELIAGTAFKYRPAGGSYFQLLNYSAITDEKDTDFAVRLTREAGIASIPVSVFYRKAPNDTLLRFCFAKKDETLERAAERLHKVIATI
ncbi:MAG: methionine aminotransferase [Bacteroidota bacterium]